VSWSLRHVPYDRGNPVFSIIFSSTLASYSLGLDGYFNNPIALDAPPGAKSIAMADALETRAGALVVGPLFIAIAASIGCVLGAQLPERKV
jgi:hypothetical protein